MSSKKVIVMLSGGLDSRLAVKIMQEKDFEVLALFFKLPFGTGCCDENCSFNFSQLQGVKLKIFDCTRGKLLQEYFEVIKKAEHGRGAGVNPCIDCRIFMLKKAKEFADREGIEIIATGEVLDERPMSQTKRAMEIVEKESGLGERLKRPLCEIGIHGRSRQKQIALAKKFKISYPNPAGGCLLCEKFLKKRFNFLLERGVNETEIKLVGIGRHFVIEDCWIIIGKNEKENKILEIIGIPRAYTKEVQEPQRGARTFSRPLRGPEKSSTKISTKGKKTGELIIPTTPGSTALIMDKCKKEIKEKVKELIKAYSNKDLKERKKFDKWKL